MNSKLQVQGSSLNPLPRLGSAIRADVTGIKHSAASTGRTAPARNPNERHLTLFSVLVPAYNEEVTLLACVEAVLAAPLPTGLEREIIVVDDASTDDTWQLAQRLA